MYLKEKFTLFVSIVVLVINSTTIFAQQIVINEIQYQNSIIEFNDGKTHDWIELYNKSEEIIQLQNYILTDDLNDDDPFIFPEIDIYPHSFITIFASGIEDSISDELHANFKMSILEDTLYLISPSYEILDVMYPQCTPKDYTLGRFPDGSKQIKSLSPSYMLSNNNSEIQDINYQTDQLSVNYTSGFYDNEIHVELSNEIKSNKIYYTIDGDDIGTDKLEYTGPIHFKNLRGEKIRFADYDKEVSDPGRDIAKANILRAQVYSSGCPASNEISNTYMIEEKNFQSHGLTVSIITDEKNLFDLDEGIYTNPFEKGSDWEREVHLEMFDTSNKQYIDQNAGIRMHGRGSRTAPQKSFRLYADKKYDAELFTYDFFDQKKSLHTFDQLLLKGVRDWMGTKFKAELCQDIVRNLNVDYSAAETYQLLLNGEYWGIYNLRERPNESMIVNNYNVDTSTLDIIAYSNSSNLEAYVYDAYTPFNMAYRTPGLVEEYGTIDSYEQLINFIDRCDPYDSNFIDKVEQQVDIESIIDFYCAQFYLANIDFINNNLSFWSNNSNRWRPIFYDLDATMHNVGVDLLAHYTTPYTALSEYEYWSTHLLRSLLENTTFKKMFHQRFLTLLNTEFSPERISGLIDHYHAKYEPMMPEHIYRWGDPLDIIKWNENVEVLYQFALQRPTELRKQLESALGKPFHIFPIPTEGIINIEFTDEVRSLDVKVQSIHGQTVFMKSFSNVEKVSVDLQIPQGIYMVDCTVDGMHYNSKIIKK